MEEITFNGFIDNLPINKTNYSYYFDGKKLNLNPISNVGGSHFNLGQYPLDFCLGRYSDGGTVAFFNNVLVQKGIFSKEINFYPTYYFRSRYLRNITTFEKIRFTGPLVNLIFPPIQMVEYDSKNLKDNPKWYLDKNNGSKTIKIKPFNDVDKVFTVMLKGLKCKCTFGMFSPGSIREQDTNLGELKTYFSIEFETPQSIEKLKEFYLIIHKFFQFLLKRQNVWFDEIGVCGKTENGYDTLGYFVDLKASAEETPKSCCQFSYYEKNIDKLFEFISQENVNFNYIAKNSQESKYVTQEQYVTCCGSFEYNYEHFYKGTGGKDTYKYTTVNDIEKFLKSIENPPKKQLKYFSHIIDVLKNDINSVETCYNRCIKRYKESINEFIEKIISDYSIDKKTNFGAHFSSFRNQKAHGELTLFSNEAVCAYLLGMALIECIILDLCNYTQEEIETIIHQRYMK